MSDEKAAGAKGQQLDDASFHVRLMINRLRRRQLATGLIIAFLAMAAVLAKASHMSQPWWLTALPLGAIGLVLCAIPPSEQWEYRAWQARPRQYERHQIQR